MPVTIWDLRGLEHSVAAYFADWFSARFDDASCAFKVERLDTPLSEFPRVVRDFRKRYPLSRILQDIVREWFGIRCGRWDVFRWRTVGDVVAWLSHRLERAEVGDLIAEERRIFFMFPVAWGPGRMKLFGEVDETAACWCGSGKPYLRCCGIAFTPKPQYAWRKARQLKRVVRRREHALFLVFGKRLHRHGRILPWVPREVLVEGLK